MTNFKRFLTLFLISTLAISVWGADVTYTFSEHYNSNTVLDATAITLTTGITATFNKRDGGTATQYYTNGTAVRWYGGGTLVINGGSNTITAITLSFGSTKGNAITADGGTYTDGSASGTGSWSGSASSVTFTQAGTSGHDRISAISITYSGGSGTDPTITFNNGSYIIGNPALDLSTLFTSNSTGTVTYTVKTAGGTGASIDGTNFTATTAGTCTVQAAQAAQGSFNAKTVTAEITVSTAPIDVTLYYKGTSVFLDDQANPYTLPTTGTYVANACDEWIFDGWYGSTYSKNTSKPTYITQLTSSGSAYAVYKHTETSGASTPITRTMNSFDAVSGYVGGDANISYAAAQGGASTPPGVYSNILRIYQNGGTLTLTANNGKKISRVTIGSSMGTTVRYQVDGGAPSSNRNISENGTVTTPEIDGGANSVTFICMGTTSSTRLYLNYLSVTYSDDGSSTTYYSTSAECGPRVQATASPWVTSAQGATVKVEVPVTATNFDANCTLSASVLGSGFSIVGWGANGNSVTAGEDLTTSLILEYGPTVFNSEATITFNSTYGGSQTPVYTAGTVHGRSLSGLFVIAIKNGGTWYALPADMSGSDTYAGVAVDVDDIDNPTKVTAGPATALYRLMGVHPGRYGDYGTRVRFVSEYNSKCLWSNQANGGTGINNGAMASSANSDNYEWTLVTTDGVTYAINTNVAKKIEEGRELRYFAGESRFGMYTSGNSSFRLLPVDCWTRATVTNVSSTYNSVTLTWAGKSGTEYNVYIDEGGVTKKTENNVSSPVTISGLDSETNYTWIISPGAKDNGCALSGDFTTNVAPINVTLSCDGTEHALGAQDKPYTLPTTGAYVANACTEWEYYGWTASPHSKSTSAPTLITQMNADGTAYAVYKKTEGGGGSGSLTLTGAQTTGGGYNTSYSVTEYTSESDAITIASNNIINNTSYIQLKSGAGNRIYNTTAMPGDITQITVTATTYSAYVYVGSSAVGSGSTALEPTSGSRDDVAVYTIPAGNTYFAVGATSNYVVVSNIEVQYASGTTYYATTSECCNEVVPPTVTVDAVDVSATISWDSQVGAVNGYNVTCTNGTNQDVAAGTTSLVIYGLSPVTTYDYIVTAKGATCNRSYEGSFTTASCSVIPTGVSITPSTESAVVRWDHASPTATVTIYSDDAASIVVKSEDGLSSGSTITGLEEGTTYYLRVFTGADCGSAIKEFTTLSSAVSIAEWFPDSIRINLTADTATATVLIEDKQTTNSSSTSYADGLFFSKYYEAYVSVKLWAIYNGTQDKISLANVKVQVSSNGAKWGCTGTGTPNNNYTTELAQYGHIEEGYIYPGEEIIVYSPGNTTPGSNDAQIISCMESTYGTAYKTNPDSLWYLKNNITTSISGDDGLILLDGTDTLDVIGGINYSTAYTATTHPSWGDADGWNDAAGTDEEGNVIGLSTNRCLLVRKNTVKNGLNAVAKNKNYFNTISEEWWGKHVPVGGNEIQTSCDNFSYVGHYNYNEYYAKFDSVTTVDELGGKMNDDGTFTIPIPDLDTLSCSMLRIKVYEGGEEKTSAEYKVPIMVDVDDDKPGGWTTNDTIFKNRWHDLTACEECDVVILKGATLTKTDAGANDASTVRNLTIYPGGTMVVPNTNTFNVNSIQFRVEGERSPMAKLKGDLITTNQQVIVSRRIKNDRYYFFSLPYDCNIADIRWSNGEIPVRGTDYEIVEYDAERRANEGSTKGAPGHWKPVTGTQLKAGVGYNIAVGSQYLKELIFPMEIGQTNLTDKEDNKSSNKVTLTKYTGPSSINNHNWNLIAHPYVSQFSAYDDAKIKVGYLHCVTPATPEAPNSGVWELLDGENVYLTMPSFSASKITYTHTISSAPSLKMDPFLAVFVQAAEAGELTFLQSNRILSAPARHLAAETEYEDESIFVGVTLSGNGQSDQTNIRIRPDFTDEYQLGYDLQKFTTYYTERPQIYMKTPSHQLAFQAVNDSVAKNTFLPMGVYCYQAGTFTFALSEDYPIGEVEAVYLYDATTGTTTNLLYDTYTITTTKQLYTNTRFALNVIVNRKAPQITTGIDAMDAPDNMVRKIFINGHVYIQRGGAIYDITGKEVFNF